MRLFRIRQLSLVLQTIRFSGLLRVSFRMGPLFIGVAFLGGCSKHEERKVTAVYACNVEFKGTDRDAVRRVHICREGAELTYDVALDRARQPRMVPDGYESGEGRHQLLQDFASEVRERTRVRCLTKFESSDDKLACLAGVRNFQRVDFERVLFADAGRRGSWMTESAVRAALGRENVDGGPLGGQGEINTR